MVYPPWESLASASPQPNFPAEYKSHNLHVNVVDPVLLLHLVGYGGTCVM